MLTGVVDRRVNCRAANVEPSRGRSLEQESDDRCETKNARTNKLLMLSSLGLDIPPSCTSEQANQVLHRRSQPRVTVATSHDDLPNLRIGPRTRIKALTILRLSPSRQFEKRRSKRIDIARRVYCRSVANFRCPVARCSTAVFREQQSATKAVSKRVRNSDVPVPGNQNVVRFDVTVEDRLPMQDC